MVIFLTLLWLLLVLLLGAVLVVGVLHELLNCMRQLNTPSPDPSPATKESAAHGRHANRITP